MLDWTALVSGPIFAVAVAAYLLVKIGSILDRMAISLDRMIAALERIEQHLDTDRRRHIQTVDFERRQK